MTGKEKFEFLTTAEMLDRMGFEVEYNEGTLPEFLNWVVKFGLFFGIVLVPYKKTPMRLKDWERERTTYRGVSNALPIVGGGTVLTLGPRYFIGDSVFFLNANKEDERNFVEIDVDRLGDYLY